MTKRKIAPYLLVVSFLCVSVCAMEWQVLVDAGLTPAAAQTASRSGIMPEGDVRRISVEDRAIFDFETLTGRLMERGSKVLLLGELSSETDETVPYNLTANWVSQIFVNGQLAFDSGPLGNDGVLHRAGRRALLPLKKGQNHVAILIERTAAFQVWGFSFWRQPDIAYWPDDPRDRAELFTRLFPAPRIPSLLYKPFVFKVSCDRAEIGVRLDSSVAAGIRFRPEGSESAWRSLWDTRCGLREPDDTHRFALEALAPDTAYEYEIFWLDQRDDGKIKELAGARGRFRTFPDKMTPFSFYCYSDLQHLFTDRPVTFRNRFVRESACDLNMKKAAFICSLGDMANIFRHFDDEYFDNFLELLEAQGVSRPFVPVRGNHEYRGDEAGRYTDVFGTPYYAFTCGDVFFIVLDTGEDHCQPEDMEAYFREEAAWLEQIVGSEACRKAARRIVLSHIPPFAGAADEFRLVRAFTGDLFFGKSPKCPIDLWLTAHTHSPARYDPVTGRREGAFPPSKTAVPLTDWDKENVTFPVITNDGPKCAGEHFSVLQVDVLADGIRVTNYNDKKVIADQIVIRRNRPFQILQTTFKPF